MDATPEEVYDLVVYQVGALAGFAAAAGTRLRHVKAHGALYTMAATRSELATAVASAVRDVDRSLVFFGLPGSELIRAGDAAGLTTACEAFADRNYMKDGSMVSRRRPDAHVTDVTLAAERAVRMVREGRVVAVTGEDIEIRVDTICVHGDGPHAAALAQALRRAFDTAGIVVAPRSAS